MILALLAPIVTAAGTPRGEVVCPIGGDPVAILGDVLDERSNEIGGAATRHVAVHRMTRSPITRQVEPSRVPVAVGMRLCEGDLVQTWHDTQVTVLRTRADRTAPTAAIVLYGGSLLRVGVPFRQVDGFASYYLFDERPTLPWAEARESFLLGDSALSVCDPGSSFTVQILDRRTGRAVVAVSPDDDLFDRGGDHHVGICRAGELEASVVGGAAAEVSAAGTLTPLADGARVEAVRLARSGQRRAALALAPLVDAPPQAADYAPAPRVPHHVVVPGWTPPEELRIDGDRVEAPRWRRSRLPRVGKVLVLDEAVTLPTGDHQVDARYPAGRVLSAAFAVGPDPGAGPARVRVSAGTTAALAGRVEKARGAGARPAAGVAVPEVTFEPRAPTPDWVGMAPPPARATARLAPVPLPSRGGHAYGPAWSPDGAWLAYMETRWSDSSPYVVKVGGGARLGEPLRVRAPGTSSSFGASAGRGGAPAWHPTLPFLLFEHGQAGGLARVYYFNPTRGSSPTELLADSQLPGSLSAPTASTHRFALVSLSSGNGDVYVWEQATNRVRAVWPTREVELRPALAPGGRYLAVETERSGRPALVVLDLDGPAQPILTVPGGSHATWTAEGLVFYRRDGADRYDLAFVDRRGEARVLARDVEPPKEGRAAVSPDGAWAAAVRAEERQVVLARVDGSEVLHADVGLSGPRDPALGVVAGWPLLAFSAPPEGGGYREIHVVDLSPLWPVTSPDPPREPPTPRPE